MSDDFHFRLVSEGGSKRTHILRNDVTTHCGRPDSGEWEWQIRPNHIDDTPRMCRRCRGAIEVVMIVEQAE